MRVVIGVVVAALLQVSTQSPARAEFSSVEDFEDLTLGSIGGQDGWSAPSAETVVAVDPADLENQVLSVTTNSTLVRMDLVGASAAIPDDTARMAFLRFRVGSQQSCSFGFSHLTSPFQFSDFGPEIGMSNSSHDLRVFDGDGDNYQELVSLSDDNWYNLWMLVDTSANTTRLWLNMSDDAAAHEDLLESDENEDTFEFRAGLNSDLIRFYIKTGGGSSQNSGPLYIDDLFIENTNAFNLDNPVSGAPFLPADFDEDGDVDGDDFLAWQTGFGTDDDADREDGDADGDHDVDGDDFLIWQSSFDAGGGSSLASVPEPCAILVAALGTVLALAVQRRRI